MAKRESATRQISITNVAVVGPSRLAKNVDICKPQFLPPDANMKDRFQWHFEFNEIVESEEYDASPLSLGSVMFGNEYGMHVIVTTKGRFTQHEAQKQKEQQRASFDCFENRNFFQGVGWPKILAYTLTDERGQRTVCVCAKLQLPVEDPKLSSTLMTAMGYDALNTSSKDYVVLSDYSLVIKNRCCCGLTSLKRLLFFATIGVTTLSELICIAKALNERFSGGASRIDLSELRREAATRFRKLNEASSSSGDEVKIDPLQNKKHFAMRCQDSKVEKSESNSADSKAFLAVCPGVRRSSLLKSLSGQGETGSETTNTSETDAQRSAKGRQMKTGEDEGCDVDFDKSNQLNKNRVDCGDGDTDCNWRDEFEEECGGVEHKNNRKSEIEHHSECGCDTDSTISLSDGFSQSDTSSFEISDSLFSLPSDATSDQTGRSNFMGFIEAENSHRNAAGTSTDGESRKTSNELSHDNVGKTVSIKKNGVYQRPASHETNQKLSLPIFSLPFEISLTSEVRGPPSPLSIESDINSGKGAKNSFGTKTEDDKDGIEKFIHEPLNETQYPPQNPMFHEQRMGRGFAGLVDVGGNDQKQPKMVVTSTDEALGYNVHWPPMPDISFDVPYFLQTPPDKSLASKVFLDGSTEPIILNDESLPNDTNEKGDSRIEFTHQSVSSPQPNHQNGIVIKKSILPLLPPLITALVTQDASLYLVSHSAEAVSDVIYSLLEITTVPWANGSATSLLPHSVVPITTPVLRVGVMLSEKPVMPVIVGVVRLPSAELEPLPVAPEILQGCLVLDLDLGSFITIDVVERRPKALGWTENNIGSPANSLAASPQPGQTQPPDLVHTAQGEIVIYANDSYGSHPRDTIPEIFISTSLALGPPPTATDSGPVLSPTPQVPPTSPSSTSPNNADPNTFSSRPNETVATAIKLYGNSCTAYLKKGKDMRVEKQVVDIPKLFSGIDMERYTRNLIKICDTYRPIDYKRMSGQVGNPHQGAPQMHAGADTFGGAMPPANGINPGLLTKSEGIKMEDLLLPSPQDDLKLTQPGAAGGAAVTPTSEHRTRVSKVYNIHNDQHNLTMCNNLQSVEGCYITFPGKSKDDGTMKRCLYGYGGTLNRLYMDSIVETVGIRFEGDISDTQLSKQQQQTPVHQQQDYIILPNVFGRALPNNVVGKLKKRVTTPPFIAFQMLGMSEPASTTAVLLNRSISLPYRGLSSRSWSARYPAPSTVGGTDTMYGRIKGRVNSLNAVGVLEWVRDCTGATVLNEVFIPSKRLSSTYTARLTSGADNFAGALGHGSSAGHPGAMGLNGKEKNEKAGGLGVGGGGAIANPLGGPAAMFVPAHNTVADNIKDNRNGNHRILMNGVDSSYVSCNYKPAKGILACSPGESVGGWSILPYVEPNVINMYDPWRLMDIKHRYEEYKNLAAENHDVEVFDEAQVGPILCQFEDNQIAKGDNIEGGRKNIIEEPVNDVVTAEIFKAKALSGHPLPSTADFIQRIEPGNESVGVGDANNMASRGSAGIPAHSLSTGAASRVLDNKDDPANAKFHDAGLPITGEELKDLFALSHEDPDGSTKLKSRSMLVDNKGVIATIPPRLASQGTVTGTKTNNGGEETTRVEMTLTDNNDSSKDAVAIKYRWGSHSGASVKSAEMSEETFTQICLFNSFTCPGTIYGVTWPQLPDNRNLLLDDHNKIGGYDICKRAEGAYRYITTADWPKDEPFGVPRYSSIMGITNNNNAFPSRSLALAPLGSVTTGGKKKQLATELVESRSRWRESLRCVPNPLIELSEGFIRTGLHNIPLNPDYVPMGYNYSGIGTQFITKDIISGNISSHWFPYTGILPGHSQYSKQEQTRDIKIPALYTGGVENCNNIIHSVFNFKEQMEFADQDIDEECKRLGYDNVDADAVIANVSRDITYKLTADNFNAQGPNAVRGNLRYARQRKGNDGELVSTYYNPFSVPTDNQFDPSRFEFIGNNIEFLTQAPGDGGRGVRDVLVIRESSYTFVLSHDDIARHVEEHVSLSRELCIDLKTFKYILPVFPENPQVPIGGRGLHLAEDADMYLDQGGGGYVGGVGEGGKQPGTRKVKVVSLELLFPKLSQHDHFMLYDYQTSTPTYDFPFISPTDSSINVIKLLNNSAIRFDNPRKIQFGFIKLLQRLFEPIGKSMKTETDWEYALLNGCTKNIADFMQNFFRTQFCSYYLQNRESNGCAGIIDNLQQSYRIEKALRNYYVYYKATMEDNVFLYSGKKWYMAEMRLKQNDLRISSGGKTGLEYFIKLPPPDITYRHGEPISCCLNSCIFVPGSLVGYYALLIDNITADGIIVLNKDVDIRINGLVMKNKDNTKMFDELKNSFNNGGDDAFYPIAIWTRDKTVLLAFRSCARRKLWVSTLSTHCGGMIGCNCNCVIGTQCLRDIDIGSVIDKTNVLEVMEAMMDSVMDEF